MALAGSTDIEVNPGGNDANGAGFNPGNANFAADGSVTSGNTSTPAFSSASYTFTASDVGYLLFLKSGTNAIPGFYPINSVAGGVATLGAAIGAADLYGGATLLNTAAGCTTVATQGSLTWGVDYSRNVSPRVSFTDAVIGATTTQFTSAGNPVGVNMVGNLINWASGTGWTVQFVEVVSVSGTTATCSQPLGTASSTGGTGKLGGALATINKLSTTQIASNKAFVKQGSGYTTNAVISFTAASVNVSNTTPATRLIGYANYRGDGGQATIQFQTNTGIKLQFPNNGWYVENIIVDCNNLGSSIGMEFDGNGSHVQNCLIKNFTLRGVFPNAVMLSMLSVEVTGGSSAAEAAVRAGGTGSVTMTYCNIHDNACPGVQAGAAEYVIEFCKITLNTGANSDGIQQVGQASKIQNNTIHGNGRHGINLSQVNNFYFSTVIKNNILTSNGGYGIAAPSAGAPAGLWWDGNAFWNNTSGARNNIDDKGTTNAQNGVAPYVNTLDVNLTGNPYTNSAGGDFTLNTMAGAGAACRGSGTPGAIPGVSQTGKLDMGCFQHADPTVTTIPFRTPTRIIAGRSYLRTRTVIVPSASVLLPISKPPRIGSPRTIVRNRAVVVPGAAQIIALGRPGRVFPPRTISRTRTVIMSSPTFVPVNRPPRQIRVASSINRRSASASAVMALFPVLIRSVREIR